MLAWKKPRPLMQTVLRLAKLQTNPTMFLQRRIVISHFSNIYKERD